MPPGPAARPRSNRDLARQREQRFGVRGVESDRPAQAALGGVYFTAQIQQHADHVVDVGKVFAGQQELVQGVERGFDVPAFKQGASQRIPFPLGAGHANGSDDFRWVCGGSV